MDIKLIGAVFGGLAATIAVLANFKPILEMVLMFVGRRARLVVKFIPTNDPYEGNQVTITNLSTRPVLFDHWAIVWVEPRRFRKAIDDRTEEEADHDWGGRTIAPHDRLTWTFAESQWFSVSAARHRGQRLVLRLYAVGEKRPYELTLKG